MKKFLTAILLLAMFAFVQSSFAQLTGTKTIPGDYATITAAVNALNTQGVGTGGVTFNVAAGYTETLTSAINMTATGTLSNPIVFIKSGVGANPLITTHAGANTPTSAAPDGAWVFQGSDYVTINGIDIYDPNTTNPQTMEYGYGFFKASVTDGCQYNTIKNCVITLNRVNNASGTAPMFDGSVGIYMGNSLFNAATTALVPTAATGSNSYNMFYANTVQNCNIGIGIYGYAAVTPFTLADINNDIGGSILSNGNNILNFGGGGTTSPSAGIRVYNQYGINISFNTVNNNNGTGVNHATTLRGIYLQGGTSASCSINNNTITLKSAVTTSQISVIENASGATAASNTITINNNTITNCANDLTTSGTWYGIYNNGGSAANLNINGNTFSNNLSKATSGATYLIYNNAAVGTQINLKRNNLSVGFNGAAAYTGTIYSVYNSSGTLLTNVNIDSNSFSNYNFATYTNSGSIYFVYNTNSSANLSLSYNNFSGLTLYNSGTHYLLYNTSSTQVALNVLNNTINGYNRTLAAGTFYGYYCGASSLGTSTQTFSGNNFSNITANVNGTGTFYGMYSSDGSASPYPKKTIFNNTLNNITYKTSGTIYGIYMSYLGDGSTTSGSSMYNNTVSNLLDSGTTYAFYPSGTASPTYANSVYGNNVNNITSLGLASSVFGYYLGAGTPGLNFYKNKAYNISSNGTTGLSYGLYTISAAPYNIYNNYIGDIQAPNSSPATTPYLAVAGMYFSSGTTINNYYNTVYLNTTSTGTNFTSAAVYGSATPTTLNFIDNIFVNLSTPKGLGYTIAYQRSSSVNTNYAATSNNNLFYAGTPSATNLIHYDGTNSYQTLAAYKSLMTPRDGAAISENPNFLSTSGSNSNYLHINSTIASQIESGGITVTSPSVVDDYDGNARFPNSGYPNNPSYPATAPDIGADEFAGIPLDLNPPTIVYTPIINSPSTSQKTLVATITDGSGVPTSGIGLPVLYWKINSGSFSSATATSLGSNQYSFTFGAGVSTGDSVFYYICAQDLNSTPNVGSFPSLGASGFSINPPACTTPPTTPSKYYVTNAPLSGDYTVGTAMFNKVTGKNITFERVVKKVMKEIYDEEIPAEKKYENGKVVEKNEPVNTNSHISGRKRMVEVDEVTWKPMENGKEYFGDLYIKKADYPNYSYPSNINGIYATLTAAVADLNLRGVGGATRFLLTDANYTTGETFPLVVNIGNVNLPTSTNTITFKPNTGVTATISGAASASSLFRIYNTNYVTIDGSNTTNGTTRNLTIQNTSVTTPQVVSINSTGTTPMVGTTIKNCTLINGVNSSSAVVLTDIGGGSGYFNNTTIQNNSIQLAYMGVFSNATVVSGNGSGLLITGNDINTLTAPVRLVGIYVQGFDGVTISNNNLGNDSNIVDASNITGIWLATGTVNATVSGNTISRLSGSLGGPRGIVVTSAVSNANVNVTGNTITNLSTVSTGISYGIYSFSTTSGVTIQKNQISNIKNSNSGGYSAIGIALGSTLTAANMTVKNNFIWDVAGYGYTSTTTDNGFGINLLSGGGYNLYFNSINLATDQTLATGNPACLIINSTITTAGSLDIRNNIFSITSTLGTNRYAVLCNATSAVFSNINYNDYYTTGPNLGYIGALSRADITAWRTGTGQDLNSISGDPKFTSSTNLHIDPAQASIVSNAGFYLANVTDDIDGNTRNNPPDIGGDEYTALKPTLISPANTSVGNDLSLNLVWSKPAGATGYRVLVATDANFTSIIANDSTLTDSIYTLTSLIPLTTYYWKVNAKFVYWGEYSSVFNFKTLGSPTVVTLSSPANNATNQPTTLTLKWFKAVDQTDIMKKGKGEYVNSGPKAVSNYWFEYGTDPTLTTVLGIDSSLTDTTKVLAGLNNLTQYYWRVKAKNQTGWSSFSSIWNFTTIVSSPGAPTLLSPLNNATSQPLALSLVWSKITSATLYHVQLSTDPGFGSFVVNDSTLTDTAKALTNLNALTNYYWRVRSFNVSGWSSFSSSWTFKTIGTASQVTLANPVNGAVNQPLAFTFNWYKAVDMTLAKGIKGNEGKGGDSPLTVTNYWFEYGTDSTFATVLARDSSLTDTTKAISGLNYITKYYWRVKAKNQIGWGSFSTKFNFTTVPNTPAVPTLLTPVNNAVDLTLTPTLDWNDVTYAASYRVQISTSNTFGTTVYDTAGLTVSQITVPSGKLTTNTVYYWRVNATNISGTSSYSTVWAFTTAPNVPNGTILALPTNGATGQPTTITFKWFKAIETLLDNKQKGKSDKESDDPLTISKYWFEYGTDPTLVTVIARDSSLTDTTKVLSGLNTGTTYYWRVKAKNQTGWGNFSSIWSFSTLVPTLSLNLKVYLEGFWDGTTQISDTVMVYLANSTTFALVDTAKVVLNATGQASMNFNRVTTGSYFIVVNHRNHLETWSKLPQSFVGGTPLSYDFTTAMTQAYGDNMKQVGSVWVLFGGDANRDGSIDANDIGIFITEFGSLGYLRSDFNGDQDVNASDVTIIANNFGLIKITPGVEPLAPETIKGMKIQLDNAIKNKTLKELTGKNSSVNKSNSTEKKTNK